MNRNSSILLAIGMLILGLVLGLITGAVGGYFAARRMQPAVSQNLPFNGQLPNQTQPNQTQPNQTQPNQTQPNQTLPNRPNRTGPRGNQPNATTVTGARVDQIVADSPAAKAGLQVGDVITAIGGTQIDQTHSLSDLVQQKKPGDSVALTVTRGGQSLTINVTLGASAQSSTTAYLGISFTPMTPGGGGRSPLPNG
jgi:membrane-associated protease RseP (regulator of RpoE activity)